MEKDVVDLLSELSAGELMQRENKKTHLVGAMITAAISPRLYLSSRRTIRSRVGTTKASVFPEPVTAWS